jgi:uncharacterized protein with PQ loop repeat
VPDSNRGERAEQLIHRTVSISITSLLATTATVYGVLGAFSSLLQARRMVRTSQSEDVSLGFLLTIPGGYMIWLLYGLSINNIPLIAVTSTGLICGTLTCAIALRLRRHSASPRPAAAVLDQV